VVGGDDSDSPGATLSMLNNGMLSTTSFLIRRWSAFTNWWQCLLGPMPAA